jgi:hypothetical protein
MVYRTLMSDSLHLDNIQVDEYKQDRASWSRLYDRLWENPVKVAGQNSEKRGKKKFF